MPDTSPDRRGRSARGPACPGGLIHGPRQPRSEQPRPAPAIGPRADRGEGHRPGPDPDCLPEGCLEAGREQAWVCLSRMTIRPDGVDHPPRRQVRAVGGHGLPNGEAVGVGRAAKLATLRQQARAGSSVDGAVDPSAAQQGAVGSVDDRVDKLGGDVTLDGLDWHHVIEHGPDRSPRGPVYLRTPPAAALTNEVRHTLGHGFDTDHQG
jgi:hypothetical protein